MDWIWPSSLPVPPVLFYSLSSVLSFFSSAPSLRIVGFYVEPLSIRHSYAGEWNGQGAAPELTSCSGSKHLTYDDIKASHQKVLYCTVLYFCRCCLCGCILSHFFTRTRTRTYN